VSVLIALLVARRRAISATESFSQLPDHASRLTGRHCATGVPLGSTPLKFMSCQRAGKLTKAALKLSQSTRPVSVVNGKSVRLSGWVNNMEYPSGASMVQKLLN